MSRTSEGEIFNKTVRRALSGNNSHVETGTILEGLDWKLAGAKPEGIPHSLYQLTNHMTYWQEWALRWLDGENPPVPKRASGSWPGTAGPANRREWERAVRRFRRALAALDKHARNSDLFTKRGKFSRAEMLHIIASHNSYHAGQMALLRRLLGSWPPPSGGVTW